MGGNRQYAGHGASPVSFMWSIGHTIRPNGEVLEGNPAEANDYVPVTRQNFVGYRSHLQRRALQFLKK